MFCYAGIYNSLKSKLSVYTPKATEKDRISNEPRRHCSRIHKNVRMRRLSAGGGETLEFPIKHYVSKQRCRISRKPRLCSHAAKLVTFRNCSFERFASATVLCYKIRNSWNRLDIDVQPLIDCFSRLFILDIYRTTLAAAVNIVWKKPGLKWLETASTI